MSERRQWAREEDDDGDANEVNQGRTKRARNYYDETQTNIRSMSSFLEQERREAAEKASTARQTTLPELIKQMRFLLNRMEGVDDQVTILLDEVSTMMNALVFCSQDLEQWISLFQTPMSVGGNSDPSLTEKMGRLGKMRKYCFDSLVSIPDYFTRRDEIAQEYIDRPQSDECLQALEGHDKAAAIEWKGRGETLLRHCEWLAHFIDLYRPLVERTDVALVNDAAYIYK